MHLQLQRTHPEIFNTRQKLAFSRQLALQYHREARRVHGVIRTSQPHNSEKIAGASSGHGDAAGACKKEGGPPIAANPLKSAPTLSAADSSLSSPTMVPGPSPTT